MLATRLVGRWASKCQSPTFNTENVRIEGEVLIRPENGLGDPHHKSATSATNATNAQVPGEADEADAVVYDWIAALKQREEEATRQTA